MEISRVFEQQLSILLNNSVLGSISIGNPMLDRSIQIVLSSLFTILVTYIITFLFKGGWRVCVRRFGIGSSHPSVFKRENVPVPDKFKYVLPIGDDQEHNDALRKWLLTYNLDKCKDSTFHLGYNIDDFLTSGKDICAASTESVLTEVKKSVNKPMPIWLHSDGNYVFLTGGSGCYDEDTNSVCFNFQLSSNSMEAIREVSLDILKFSKKLTSTVKEEELEFKTCLDGNPTDCGYVNRKKTIDKMFFKNKPEIVNLLNKFKKKTLIREGVPLDNKLGFLLHGPPGTGKSGLIQAIANYTNRGILEIDIRSINPRQLDRIWMMDPEKWIFVFEEFDCLLTEIKSRAEPKESSGENNKTFIINSSPLSNKKDKNITLDILLKKMDGIGSNEGRIIIATTNYPEKVDPALKRAGRLNMVELSYCDSEMLKGIISMSLGLTAEQTKKLVFTDAAINVWTPMDVIQKCLENDTYNTEKDLRVILKILNKGKP